MKIKVTCKPSTHEVKVRQIIDCKRLMKLTCSQYKQASLMPDIPELRSFCLKLMEN